MTDVAFYADLVRRVATGIAGTGSLAAIVAVLVAGGYRWLTTRAPPAGTAVLAGLSAVGGYLSYTVLTAGTIFDGIPLVHQAHAGYLLATFAVAGTAGAAGGRLGDRIACQVLGIERIGASGEAASTVRSARLAVDLELPDRIEDANGYRPVTPATRRALEGAVVRLPHGLSVSERRARIERHLERDYDIEYTDVTMADDGSVERVLVGRRSAGLGSTLPPKTVAVAIRTHPLPDASVGDPVEIWSTGDPIARDSDTQGRDRRSALDRGQLVATGTLRTVTGTVATVFVDADRADVLSADESYRVVTRPDERTDGYEFASTIRAADETVTALTVVADGPLAGEFVGWLPGRVLVIDREDDRLALPDDSETLRAGDTLWLLASPTALDAFDPVDTDAREPEPIDVEI